MLSDFLKLNLWDFVKAAILAVLAAFIGAIYGTVDAWVAAGAFPAWPVVLESIKNAGGVSLLAGLSYLLKNLLTGPGNVPFKKD